ncbi:MAG: VWA domain-containing protein [Spirochaetes bacterium]|nr:VWA domain-containing protein [Spirochaetota bacterium]
MKKSVLLFACAVIIGPLVACSEKKPVEKAPVHRQEALTPRLEWPPGLGTGQASPVADVRMKNYYIVFDGSGSMYHGRKIQTAQKALEVFVLMIPPDANVALLAFDARGVYERAPFGTPRETIIREIHKTIARGGTPLGRAVEIAYDKILAQARRQLGYGEYSIVIVTDGMATDGERLPRIIGRILDESPVMIHTIGFDIGMGHALNQPGLTSYRTARNFHELTRGLGEVLAESDSFSTDGL